jgi:hypothetical protein
MAIERNEQGTVKLVISKATWQQLCGMADVVSRRRQLVLAGEQVNVPVILPRGYRSEPTFWVCAAMVLGNADAMMLAAISHPESDGEIWFDGLELF